MSGTLPTTSLVGWRLVRIEVGDTLQDIALREIGDASRWAELATLNNLLPPYITTDPAEAAAAQGRLKTPGETLYVFAPSPRAEASANPDDLYLTDLAISGRRLTAGPTGDYATLSGWPNLRAAIERRLDTPERTLTFHPDYGSLLHMLIGRTNRAQRASFAAYYIRRALLLEQRIDRVPRVRAEASGDRLAIEADIIPAASGAVETIRAEV